MPDENIAKFDKQGHRGCRGLMPENTIPAMLLALDLGVTTLEMDVVISKDKMVVLSHEPFFSHEITTKPEGNYVDEKEERSLNIYQMNYEEIRTFDVGLKPHPRFPQQKKITAYKPLLAELIDRIENHCSKNKLPLPNYNIEIKSQDSTDNVFHPSPKEFIILVMNIIQQKGISQRVNIQSFDFRTLQHLQQLFPAVKSALLIEADDKRNFEEQLKDLGFLPDIYSPEYSLITKELVEKCHARKIQIIPWTVNDKKMIGSLKAMGVDGLISDYPDLLNE